MIGATIVVLNDDTSPATIRLAVTEIRVSPVKGSRVRAFSHISKENREVVPLFADSYPATTVKVELRRTRIVAPVSHTAPRRICPISGPGHPVSSVFPFLGFGSQATTTARVSTPDVLNIDDNSLSAVAQASCSATLSAASRRHELNHQFPESSAHRFHNGVPSLRYNTIIRHRSIAGAGGGCVLDPGVTIQRLEPGQVAREVYARDGLAVEFIGGCAPREAGIPDPSSATEHPRKQGLLCGIGVEPELVRYHCHNKNSSTRDAICHGKIPTGQDGGYSGAAVSAVERGDPGGFAGARVDDDCLARTTGTRGFEANPKDWTYGSEIGPLALRYHCASQP